MKIYIIILEIPFEGITDIISVHQNLHTAKIERDTLSKHSIHSNLHYAIITKELLP